MLDIKKLLTKILQTLGVQTSNSWYYLTIGGMFIGARTYSGTLSITTQAGQVYTTTNATLDFPVTLSTNLFSDIKVVSSSYNVWTAIMSTSTSQVQFRAMSTASRASASYTIKALVVGVMGGVANRIRSLIPAYSGGGCAEC